MPEINFNPRETNLQVGVEFEYPVRGTGDSTFQERAENSEMIDRSRVDWTGPGRPEWDGTVGLEVVSNPIGLHEMPGFVENVIEYVELERGYDYQPTGLLKNGSTVGTHLHLSPISEPQARTLYEMSREPWMQVFACSSVVVDDDGSITAPVFRGGDYCRSSFDSGHYSCVNQRHNDHWEWRLPEPVTPDHASLLAEFLNYFEDDPEVAKEFALAELNKSATDITAIRRANNIGIDQLESDEREILREPAPTDPEEFYYEVEDEWSLPEIYQFRYNGTEYYAFNSDLAVTFEVMGVEFGDNTILYADSLNPVEDDYDEIRGAFVDEQSDSKRETEATKQLKEIVK